MEKWRRQHLYLKAIAEGTPKQRQHVLHHANRQLLDCLCECALNILEGPVRLNSTEEKALARHHRKLKTLAYSNVPLKYKRAVLRQRGAGKFFKDIIVPVLKQLPSLLPALIPLLL